MFRFISFCSIIIGAGTVAIQRWWLFQDCALIAAGHWKASWDNSILGHKYPGTIVCWDIVSWDIVSWDIVSWDNILGLLSCIH